MAPTIRGAPRTAQQLALMLPCRYRRYAHATRIAADVLRRRRNRKLLARRPAEPRDAICGEPADSRAGDALRAAPAVAQRPPGDAHPRWRAPLPRVQRDSFALRRGRARDSRAGERGL